MQLFLGAILKVNSNSKGKRTNHSRNYKDPDREEGQDIIAPLLQSVQSSSNVPS